MEVFLIPLKCNHLLTNNANQGLKEKSQKTLDLTSFLKLACWRSRDDQVFFTFHPLELGKKGKKYTTFFKRIFSILDLQKQKNNHEKIY